MHACINIKQGGLRVRPIQKLMPKCNTLFDAKITAWYVTKLVNEIFDVVYRGRLLLSVMGLEENLLNIAANGARHEG
jgi:hypothetical protein